MNVGANALPLHPHEFKFFCDVYLMINFTIQNNKIL